MLCQVISGYLRKFHFKSGLLRFVQVKAGYVSIFEFNVSSG